MERKIAVCLNFDDAERLNDIQDFCRQNGFTPKIMTIGSLDEDFIKDCEVLFGFFPRKILKEAKNLKWFQCSYAGVDKFSDESIYHSKDVILTNSKGAYGITISEHMICTTLMMMRKFPQYIENQRQCKWQGLGDIKSIYGSTATVIGLGDIGSNYAKRLKAMGAYVKAVKANTNVKPDFVDEVFSPSEIDEAIKNSDIVALSMPSTEGTRGTMTEEKFKLLKKGCYFINVGRGDAIDQNALCECLKKGDLAAAALDVFDQEPLSTESSIWKVPNLIITPHISGNTNLPLTRDLIVDIFKSNMKCYLAGESLKNVVNKKQGY